MEYILNKISSKKFENKPFKHLYIEDFFENNEFEKIINDAQINTKYSSDLNDLFKNLDENEFKEIVFPGCTVSRKHYASWIKNKNNKINSKDPVEGYGMVFRMFEYKSDILKEIKKIFESQIFKKTLAEKFDIDSKDLIFDWGIQKYLDGYEISPHPDIRKKALTFMININNEENSEKLNYHTKYLKLKDKYNYIQDIWNENKDIDRCWVPWNWAEEVKNQPKNNSIVIFSPSNDTWHAVKANYNHLKSQRTQIYGNLWYKDTNTIKTNWKSYDVVSRIREEGNVKDSFLDRLTKKISKTGVRKIK